MLTVPPGSTVALTYTPLYDGVALTAAPSSYNCVYVHESGSDVPVSAYVEWITSASALRLTVPDTIITNSDNNTMAQVVWTWTYNNQTYRDAEKFCVTDSYFGELTVRLRRYIKDTGVVQNRYYVADGVTTEYPFQGAGTFVPTETLSVFVNGASTTAYAFNKLTGMVTLNSAPSSGQSVRLLYMRYDYANDELEEFIVRGITDYNRYLSATLATNVTPTVEAEKTLVLLLAARQLYIAEMLRSVKDSINWRDEEKSVSRSGVPGNYARTIKALEDQINDIVVTTNYRSTLGYALAGGNTELVKFESVDWSGANG